MTQNGADEFDVSALGERDSIAVFGTQGIVEGSIPRIEKRISDALNEAARIRIRVEGVNDTPSAPVELDLAEVVAVAAAPRSPSPHRVATRRHSVEVEAGPYRVRGTAHFPPGADPTRYVASTSRRWLPLTDCRVATGEDEWAVDVLIVNLRQLTKEIRAFNAPPFG